MNEENIDKILETDLDKEFSKALEIKKHILNFIDKNIIITFLVNTVKESTILNFERPDPEKYISPSMPVLEIYIDEELAKVKYPKLLNLNSKERDKRISARGEVVYSELVVHFTNLMADLYNKIIGKIDESVYDEYLNKLYNFNNTNPDVINSIIKDPNSDEYSYIFTMITSVNFPIDDEQLLSDTGCTV